MLGYIVSLRRDKATDSSTPNADFLPDTLTTIQRKQPRKSVTDTNKGGIAAEDRRFAGRMLRVL
jgi:hypothetical protein